MRDLSDYYANRVVVNADEIDKVLPRGVVDPRCSRGARITETTTDHRLLWHLENWMAVCAPQGGGDMRTTLRRYLNETCQHHWHYSPAEEGFTPQLWQCLWCYDVLLPDEGGHPPIRQQCCDDDGTPTHA